jgi:WD40 repeat protein
MADSPRSAAPKFLLSASLGPMDDQVRDVCAIGNDLVAAAAFAGQVAVWDRDADGRRFVRRDVFRQKMHAGLIFCVTPVPPGLQHAPENSFVSGGNDHVARLWSAQGSVVAEFKGHRDCVNSVSFAADGHVLTGSWDGDVRVWDATGRCVQTLGGHANATEVLGLASGEVVTASTNKSIVILRPDRTLLRKLTDAHDHAIRKLAAHPRGFVSCGNDGFVKVWSRAGEQLLSIPAHISGKTDKFCYGVAVLATGELASCGEDATVRVWSAGGELQQVLQHSGPVRAVFALPNGDLATACNDRYIRIFTRDASRVASADERQGFENAVQISAASNSEAIDPSSFPGEEALEEPGSRDGAIRVINRDGKAIVFKWHAEGAFWEEVGEATGRRVAKTVFEGREYDHVTDVFVTDDIKYKLAFNTDDDAAEVTERFCARYSLPDYLKEQVLEHVSRLTDPALARKRKEEEAKQRERQALRQLPAWVTGDNKIYSECKAEAMKAALLKFNADAAARPETAALALREEQLPALHKLMATVADTRTFHSSSLSAPEVDVLERMLQWRGAASLPVLDCFRVLMCHQDAVKKVGLEPRFQRLLLERLRDDSSAPRLSLVLKAVSNLVAKRIRSASERKEQPSVPPEFERFVAEALDALAGGASHENENVVSAYVMLAHNIVHWLGRVGVRESELYMVLATGLVEVLEHADRHREETFFYALLSLASIAVASPSARADLMQAFGDVVMAAAGRAAQSKAPALVELSEDVTRTLGRQE